MAQRAAIALVLVACVLLGLKLFTQPGEHYDCNYDVQSFDFSGTTVYWRVVRGACNQNDVNFDNVGKEIAVDLGMSDVETELTDAKCKTSITRVLYAVGRDYYAVDELDCANPVFRLHEDQAAQKEALLKRDLRRKAEKEALMRKVAERDL